MSTDFLAVAGNLFALAGAAANDGQGSAALLLFEQAYSTALMQNSDVPIHFKIVTRETLPFLASVEHIVLEFSRSSVTCFAVAEILARPCSDYRRFPAIGLICSAVCKTVPTDDLFQCILDVGDGDDLGPYDRVAFSSALPRTALIVDPYFPLYKSYDPLRRHVAEHGLPWRERKDMVFWRGTTTGRRWRDPLPDQAEPWDWLPRLHLCATCRDSRFAARLDVGLTDMAQIAEPDLRRAIRDAGFMKPAVTKTVFVDYRYQIDIDGWSNAWSLIDKLIMGATIFKVMSPLGYRQSFYDALVPFETHIPVKSDLSDFDEQIAWAFDHPDQCEKIAANAAALGGGLTLDRFVADAPAKIWSVMSVRSSEGSSWAP